MVARSQRAWTRFRATGGLTGALAAFACAGVTMMVGADSNVEVASLREGPTAVLPEGPTAVPPAAVLMVPTDVLAGLPADVLIAVSPTDVPPGEKAGVRGPADWVAGNGLRCSRFARKARAPAWDGSSASASTANRRAASRELL